MSCKMTNSSAPWSRVTNSPWVKLGIAGAITAAYAAVVMLALKGVASVWGWQAAGAGDASLAAIFTIALVMGAIVLCAGLGRHIASTSADTLMVNGGAGREPFEAVGRGSISPAASPAQSERENTSAHLFADQYESSRGNAKILLDTPEYPSSQDLPQNPDGWLPTDGRILLAETNDYDRRAIAAMMDRCGMEVEIAANAEDAIEMLLAANEFGEPFDLALIDAYMPRSDGFTICRAIRSAGIEPEAMPIIALLPDLLVGDAASRTPSQSQAYIFKPVMIEDLVSTLNRWLPHRIVEETARPLDDPLDDLDINEIEDELERWMSRRSDAVNTIERAIAHHAFDGRSRRLLANALRQIARTAGLYGEEELGKRAAMLERALHDGDGANDCRKLAEAFLAAAQHSEQA